eukprot:g24696.t1
MQDRRPRTTVLAFGASRARAEAQAQADFAELAPWLSENDTNWELLGPVELHCAPRQVEVHVLEALRRAFDETKHGAPDLPRGALVALLLCHEMRKGKDSAFAGRRMSHGCMPAPASLCWPRAAAFAAPSPSNTSQPSPPPRGTMLIPVADGLNHSPSKANCEVLQHPDAIEVVASCEIDAEEELLLCYGAFSNAELLFNAGR